VVELDAADLADIVPVVRREASAERESVNV
jgi:hypothetical protein